jgi:hypothetical protein
MTGQKDLNLTDHSSARLRRRRAALLRCLPPFSSVTAVAKRHFPFLPGMLVRDAYRADLALPCYSGPVGFWVAGRDEVVFPDLGLALFEARTGPKRLWIEPDANHNGIQYDPCDPRWREVLARLPLFEASKIATI